MKRNNLMEFTHFDLEMLLCWLLWAGFFAPCVAWHSTAANVLWGLQCCTELAWDAIYHEMPNQELCEYRVARTWWACLTFCMEKNSPLCGREVLLEKLLHFFCKEAFLLKISGSDVHVLGGFTQVYAAKICSFPQKTLLYFLQLLICLVQT